MLALTGRQQLSGGAHATGLLPGAPAFPPRCHSCCAKCVFSPNDPRRAANSQHFPICGLSPPKTNPTQLPPKSGRVGFYWHAQGAWCAAAAPHASSPSFLPFLPAVLGALLGGRQPQSAALKKFTVRQRIDRVTPQLHSKVSPMPASAQRAAPLGQAPPAAPPQRPTCPARRSAVGWGDMPWGGGTWHQRAA